ncbi:hypothetical protein ABGB19_25830 [Mycobacterium sp. B14F4]|uniref:hypothetical protein n=1 Tax=Mycobacterium sp. B14F4 TaxID=3153565 RepID=UPI00325C6320
MTLFSLQTGTERDIWRRVVIGGIAGAAVAATLITGAGAPTASAQPAAPTTTEAPTPTAEADGPKTPCTGDDCKRVDEDAEPQGMTADQALAIIQADYDLGAGGGKLSNLIHDVLTLRAQGYRPSNANRAAIEQALQYRPNQTPLIEALQETLAYQRKQQMRAQQAAAAQGPVAGPVPVIPGMTMPVG